MQFLTQEKILKIHGTGKAGEICVYNFGFARLLKILGCPEGDKTLKQFSIPEWVLKDKIFMREFINTLFGNECQKICLRSKRIGTVQFKMVKSIDLKENLVFFLNQIEDYLNNFGVETGKIKFKKSYIRETDSKEMVIAYFNINMNKRNVLRVSKMLSFRYAALKQKLFEECVEKATQDLHKILGRITLYNKIIKLNKEQNLKCSEISEKLNVPLSTVNNWINGYKPQFINNEKEIINLLRLT